MTLGPPLKADRSTDFRSMRAARYEGSSSVGAAVGGGLVSRRQGPGVVRRAWPATERAAAEFFMPKRAVVVGRVVDFVDEERPYPSVPTSSSCPLSGTQAAYREYESDVRLMSNLAR